jgi:bifunctional DNA-binding transcriptional regulator/antitoxin component of YhaV-PrlF toxin-antitoxin module
MSKKPSDVVYSDKSSDGHWEVRLEEDGDDVILPLPQEILDHLELQEGDQLEWINNEDGTWSLRKLKYDSDSGLTENL